MVAFIKRHWVAYLVGAVVAVLLGLGVSFFLGMKWSTPADVRAERVASEQRELPSVGDLEDGLNDGGEQDAS